MAQIKQEYNSRRWNAFLPYQTILKGLGAIFETTRANFATELNYLLIQKKKKKTLLNHHYIMMLSLIEHSFFFVNLSPTQLLSLLNEAHLLFRGVYIVYNHIYIWSLWSAMAIAAAAVIVPMGVFFFISGLVVNFIQVTKIVFPYVLIFIE